MKIHFLSLEEVLSIQQQLINTFGGLPGLRDVALLEAALMASTKRLLCYA